VQKFFSLICKSLSRCIEVLMADAALQIHEEGELLDDPRDQVEGGGVDSPVLDDNADNYARPERGVLDPAAQALDQFITDTTANPGEDEQSQGADDENFLEELANIVADVQGPAVSTPVEKLINTHLARDFSTKNRAFEDSSQSKLIINKFKDLPVPINLPELRSCKVNDGVFKAMTPSAKRANGDLHSVETAWCKTITSQALALEELASLKELAPKNMKTKFNQVISNLASAVEFSCFGRAKTNDIRRSNILASLNEDYRHLAVETQPGKGLLFGNDLENAMKSVETTNRLAKKLAGKQQTTRKSTGRGAPFLASGRNPGPVRGRNNRRHSPYYNPRYNYQHNQQGYQSQNYQ
jgi:hypothetical protein